MGRGTRTGLPDSWKRFVNWQEQIKKRGELKEKRVQKKERTVGKETYTEIERVRLQDIKSKLWNIEGVVKGVRTADDGTILSYYIDIDGTITSRHREYMCKIRNSDEATAVTEEEIRAGAIAAADSFQQ